LAKLAKICFKRANQVCVEITSRRIVLYLYSIEIRIYIAFEIAFFRYKYHMIRVLFTKIPRND